LAIGWPSTRRLRQQPLRPDLSRASLELGLKAANLVELRAEPLHAPKLRGDLRERAGGVLVEPADTAFGGFELAADRPRPGVCLLTERAELGLGRRPVVEHLAEAFDQGEVELGHLGGRAILKGEAL
jgi:hypothetical protein